MDHPHQNAALRWSALSVPLAGDVVSAALALGGPDLVWAQPGADRICVGVGVEAALEGRALGPLLGAAQVPGELLQGGPELPGPWFAGAAFDPARLWEGWPAARLVLPQLLIWRDQGRAWLSALSVRGDASALHARLDAAHALLSKRRIAFPSTAPQAVRTRADEAAWERLVWLALEEIRAGRLQKVVLAHAMAVQLAAAPSRAAIASWLIERHPQCATFLLPGPTGSFFAGATPETLCELHGDGLVVDALAGSAPPGDDTRLAMQVKERAEHRWVVDSITTALRGLVTQLHHPPEPALLRLPNVSHLHTPIRAHLRDGVSLADVVTALHPTPAVGGVPRPDAVRFLKEHEAFARGWYAGPVGLVGANHSHLCVALRCALVDGYQARVFVGAGVVEGSEARLEWEETLRKARPMLEALSGGGDAPN